MHVRGSQRNDAAACASRRARSFIRIVTYAEIRRRTYVCAGRAFEGHRVSQYLIASGYECWLDTSEIARREGLESGTEMGNRRKTGRKEDRRADGRAGREGEKKGGGANSSVVYSVVSR